MKSVRTIVMITMSLPIWAIGPAWGAAPKVTYDEHIQPIFRQHCSTCHKQDKARADLNVMTYAGVLAGGSGGEVVASGDGGASKLYLVMAHQAEPKMPPKGSKLPDKELDLVKAWIDGGLLENATGKAKASKKPKMDLSLASAPVGKPAQPITLPADLLLEPALRTPRAQAVTAIASNPWAPLWAVAAPKQIVLYHGDSLDIVGVLPFPEGTANVLKFSRNGLLLLAAGGHAGKSGKAVVWQVQTGKRVIEVGDELDAILAADISADQTQLAIGGASKLVKVLSIETGEPIHTIKKHTDWVTALEFSPDGVLLASGDRAGGFQIWESFSGREFYSLPSFKAAVTDISWRDDSNVVAAGSEDGTIRLHEMFNGTQAAVWNAHGGVLSLEYAHDGRIVSCGRDRVTRIYDQAGKALKEFEPFADLALRVAISHDGQRVAAGDWTGDIRVWSVADGKRIGSIESNPPTLAERVGTAEKEVAALDQAAKAAEQAVNNARLASAQALETLVASHRALSAAQQARVSSEGEQTKQRQRSEQALASLKTLDAEVPAKQGLSATRAGAANGAKAAHDQSLAALKQTTDIAAAKTNDQKAAADELAKAKQVQAAAPKDPRFAASLANAVARSAVVEKELADANAKVAASLAESKRLEGLSVKAKGELDQANADLAAAQKKQAELRAAQKAADDAAANAAKALAAAQQAVTSAQAQVNANHDQAVKVSDAAIQARSQHADANARLASARLGLSRWQKEHARARVVRGKEDLAAQETQLRELTNELAQAKESAAKSAAGLADAQQLASTGPARIKSLQDELASARRIHDQAQVSLASTQAVVAEREAQVKPLADLVAKVKASADKLAGNKTVTDASLAVKQGADLLASDLELARKAAASQAEQFKKVQEKLKSLDGAIAQLTKQVADAAKNAPTLATESQRAAANVQAKEKAIAQLHKEIAEGKARLERWSVQFANLKTP